MSYVATKAFNTLQRRIKVGATIEEGDDLSPHNIESLKAAGLIAAEGDAPDKPSWLAPKPGED